MNLVLSLISSPLSLFSVRSISHDQTLGLTQHWRHHGESHGGSGAERPPALLTPLVDVHVPLSRDPCWRKNQCSSVGSWPGNSDQSGKISLQFSSDPGSFKGRDFSIWIYGIMEFIAAIKSRDCQRRASWTVDKSVWSTWTTVIKCPASHVRKV